MENGPIPITRSSFGILTARVTCAGTSIQVRLYSGSYNKIHVWKASDNFALVHEFETQYGAIYSLAVSKKYIITGEPTIGWLAVENTYISFTKMPECIATRIVIINVT